MSKIELPTLQPIKLSKISLDMDLLICEIKDQTIVTCQLGAVVFNTDEHVEIKTQKVFSKKHMKKFYGIKWVAYKTTL